MPISIFKKIAITLEAQMQVWFDLRP